MEVGKPEVTIGPSGVRHGFAIPSGVNHPSVLVGTSSFTATGWQGSFYPKGLRRADYLSYNAQGCGVLEAPCVVQAPQRTGQQHSLGQAGEKGRGARQFHKRLLYCFNVNRTSLDHLLLGRCAHVDKRVEWGDDSAASSR